MSGIEMMNDLQALCQELTKAVERMRICGRRYAEAEAKYKVALKRNALQLRSIEDMPVTLIDKVVYGYVADERLQRDIAETEYKTALENVNAIKLRIRILDNQIGREWGGERRGS